jgi:hypothetical protein
VAADDAILLVASGDKRVVGRRRHGDPGVGVSTLVVAGVDLGRLQPPDVSVAADARAVSQRLPKAEVFSARLDNART